MENLYPRPEPYVPLYQIHQRDPLVMASTSPWVLKRRYSRDRSVDSRNGEFTMQKARRESEKGATSSQQYADEDRIKVNDISEVNVNLRNISATLDTPRAEVNYFQEWRPEDEEYTFNIRPGRNMFPFIREALLQKDHHCKVGDDCLALAEPLTLPRYSDVWRTDEAPRLFVRRGPLELDFGLWD